MCFVLHSSYTDKILTVLGMNLDKQCEVSDSCMIVQDHTRDSCLIYMESRKIKDTDKILTVLGMILSKNLDKQCEVSDSCMIVKDHTRNMRDSCLTYVGILQDHVARICFNFLTQSCKTLATYHVRYVARVLASLENVF